ncbi:hypothetical protein GCM10029978_065770 [Actinoallomurus acanthiterrae]
MAWRIRTGILDTAQRIEASRLDQATPNWLVLWSYEHRLFRAWPRWPAPAGLILTDTDPARLRAAMHAYETQHTAANRPGP